MSVLTQTAGVVWDGTIARGEGRIRSGSHALDGLQVDLPNRRGDEHDKTTPEELVAAAHATCFTMALGATLAGERTPPERLAVDATCMLEGEPGQKRITSIHLVVRGRVPDATAESFAAAVAKAEQQCVISKALKAAVEIGSTATLE
jgi:osmotically inducible protein OsmC